jgi:hypothetical protein
VNDKVSCSKIEGSLNIFMKKKTDTPTSSKKDTPTKVKVSKLETKEQSEDNRRSTRQHVSF